MLLQALLATAHDLLVGLGIATVALVFVGLVLRSNQGLKRREQERCRVTEEEVVRAFDWPPKRREISS